jgi:hypothetical protein
MKQLQTPHGDLIVGILECVPGNALVSGFEDDLTPDYEGETKMFWEGQISIIDNRVDGSFIANYTNDPKKRIYLDDEGNEWVLSDLTVIDDDNEDNN